MRMRSIPYLAVCLISWLFVWRYVEELNRKALHFGSTVVVAPVPPHITFLALGCVGSALVGLPMLLVDFTRWIKNRKA
jgi:hypothetical protein